jgi:hypothetical protein
MTTMNRRSLLGTGALGAALSPFLAGGAAQASKPRVAYSRARFLPLRRRTFRVSGPGGRWTARLLEISDLSSVQRGEDQAFGLTFRFRRPGPEQGVYTVERHLFAPISLFLVPTGAGRRTYYAVVNRTV